MSDSQTNDSPFILYANGRALPALTPLLSVPATTFAGADFALDDDCVSLCLNLSACSGRSYAYNSEALRSVVSRLTEKFTEHLEFLVSRIAEWNEGNEYYDGTAGEILNIWLAAFDLIGMACDDGESVCIEDSDPKRQAMCHKQARNMAAFLDEQMKKLR